MLPTLLFLHASHTDVIRTETSLPWVYESATELFSRNSFPIKQKVSFIFNFNS